MVGLGVMPRPLRAISGTIDQVMNGGDRREAIFKDEKDHRLFLETLAQACEKTGWQIHAWIAQRLHMGRWEHV